MKSLLTISAIFEGTTGVALLLVPTLVVSLLLGIELTEPVGILVGRITGVALLTIAVICWLYRSDENTISLSNAMVFYNIGSGSILIYAWILGFIGLGLWPAVALHAGLALWCFKSIPTKAKK